MHLGLTHSPSSFSDGTGSWNGSAADALNIWNQYIDKVKFVAGDSLAGQAGDGANSVFFSNNVYGQTWGTGVLAVTLRTGSQGNIFTETDVLFNNKLKWSSYRGNLIVSGPGGTYDFHRVALHEFGHVLGLDHPDDHGQLITAIMNSIIGDLDHLAADDIAGARSLYQISITSSQGGQFVKSGSPFSYQITAPIAATNYSATGLPPGIQVDPNTGLISGSCPTSGDFTVNILVEGATIETSSGSFYLHIDPLRLTSAFYAPQILIGESFSYQITAESNPTSFSATNLPAGLSLDATTGIISGIPTVTGQFQVQVVASGATSQAVGTVIITISPPYITSPTNVRQLEIGDSFSYQITSTHHPTSFSATGLPPLFQVDSATGIITGTATTANVGNYYPTIKAETAFGEATAYFLLFIEPPRLTSSNSSGAQIGNNFLFQITASNHPTSFSAAGLPAGLTLDPATGLISGVATLSGNYVIFVTAHGSVGDATGYITMTVSPGDFYNPPLAKVFLGNLAFILADSERPRIYAASWDGVTVLDSESFAVVKQIPMSSGAWSLGISADGSKLYCTTSYLNSIAVINLETLEVRPELAIPGYSSNFAEQGADGYLYVGGNHGTVLQVDPATGATLNQISLETSNDYIGLTVKLSPDRNTLFVGESQYLSPLLAKYSLSSGNPPALQQKIRVADTTRYGTKLTLSPDGQFFALPLGSVTGDRAPAVQLRSTSDLNQIQATLPTPYSPDEVAFSPDGLFAVQLYYGYSRIDIFDLPNHKLIQSLTPADHAFVSAGQQTSHLTVSNTHLSAALGGGGGATYLYTYPLPLPAPPKSILNVSTRLRTQTGDNVLIGGFIVGGTEPKKLLIRATGPSLPVTGKLMDPTLELHNPDGSIVINDNWNQHRTDVLASGLAPADEHEAAIVATLQPGVYTAIVRGSADTTGVALVEVYDLSPNSNSKITNISTRGKVEIDDNVMIAGFIIGGDQPTKVIVRALGPSLTASNVAGVLTDTTLELHDSNGTAFAFNDDWQSDQVQEIKDTKLAPPDPHEAALVRTLPPGLYTAIVHGKNNATGVALVEVYNLESN